MHLASIFFYDTKFKGYFCHLILVPNGHCGPINRCDVVWKKIITKTSSFVNNVGLSSLIFSSCKWLRMRCRFDAQQKHEWKLASLCWLWVKKCLGRLHLATVSKVEANASSFGRWNLIQNDPFWPLFLSLALLLFCFFFLKKVTFTYDLVGRVQFNIKALISLLKFLI